MAGLMASVAEKLRDFVVVMRFGHRGGLRGVDVELLWRTLMVSFNVESVTPPANGGCIGVPAACPVGLMSAGGRVRTW